MNKVLSNHGSIANSPHSGTPRQMFRPRQPLGFTLIELLVVISIIAVLIALLLPALTSAAPIEHGVSAALGGTTPYTPTMYGMKIIPGQP